MANNISTATLCHSRRNERARAVVTVQERQTALHIASRLGNVDNVVLLLQHGASPDSATHDLYTALHIASKEGHDDVVRILLEHGANQTLLTNVCTSRGANLLFKPALDK